MTMLQKLKHHCWICMASLVSLAIFAGFFVFGMHTNQSNATSLSKSDAIVVFTGDQHRIGEALKLLKRGEGKRLLISGVNPRFKMSDFKRRFSAYRNEISCCVDLDYEAKNTRGNAYQTSAWAKANGIKSLVLVTSAYHMPRSLLMLGRALDNAGIDIAVKAHPVQTAKYEEWWNDPSASKTMAAEYVKYIATWIGIESVERDIHANAMALPKRRPTSH